MKKNYTLKLVLVMLVVVLVSLVSFVGVYKGKNLLKDYSLGKDFGQRKVAMFSVVEEEEKSENKEDEATENKEEATEKTEEAEKKEETAENTEEVAEKKEEATESSENKNEEKNNEKVEENNNSADNQKKKDYNNAKNNIARRLTAMKSEEYDIRLDEATGMLAIEVPVDMNSTYLTEIVSKGKVQIKNTSSNEYIVDGNVFKDASAKMDTTTYSKAIVALNMKYTKDAKKKLGETGTTYKDSDGNESEATWAVLLDGETLYSDKASTFVNSSYTGELNLVMGQNDEGEELEKDYQNALAITAIIKCGEIPVKYEINSMELISSGISVKAIVMVAIVVGALMFLYAMFRFKTKAILPVISLVGLVATTLLVLRYTNVRITLFTVLGLAIITVANYLVILRALSNEKTFKQNFIEALNALIPCIVIAIVLCCTPYLQLASFGMTFFWGLLVMCIYNAVIVRVLMDK